MKTLKTKSRFGVHFWSLLLAVGMLLALANVAHAATEAEKQTAIDAGLAYLAGVQLGDGHWEYGDTGSDIGTTGAALLAFIEEGHTPTSATAYSANVANGLNYLLSYAQSYPISLQPAGDPDTLVNGIGVKFNDTAANNSRDIYATGLALMPIAAVGTPAAIVGAGPQTGRTYADVIQDTVDYLAYAQNEGGWPRGGWRYYANQGSSDNSTSQWPTVALLYAQSAGATVPAFVATELAIWVNYIQNPGDGGSYYDNNFVNWGSNVSRTGTLLVQQVFSGAGAGTAAAQNYLNNQWLTGLSGSWNGNFGHPYSMWAAYKGLEVTIGLDADQSVISNLHADPGDVDNPNHGWNWWEDYCENLVNTQNLNGSWSGYSVWSPTLATAWYINILAATEIPPPNQPPVADAGIDRTVEQESHAGTLVTLDGSGSTDPDSTPGTNDDIVVFDWYEATPLGSGETIDYTFQLGSHTVRLVVTDNYGDTDDDEVIITVEDTTPPTVNCPDDVTVEQESHAGTVVPLQATATDICDPNPVITSDKLAVYPLGVTTVTFTATDASGNSASCSMTVTVVDTIPPTINSISASPDTLWPPNHKMVEVTVAVDCEDICDSAPVCQIVNVTSNEPINDLGDGNTEADWEITGPYTVNLRAERAGVLTGRVYTIHVECTDVSGNTTTDTVDVTVPHNQGKGKK